MEMNGLCPVAWPRFRTEWVGWLRSSTCCDLTIVGRFPSVAAAGWLRFDAVLSLEGVLDGEDQHAEGAGRWSDRRSLPEHRRLRAVRCGPQGPNGGGHAGHQQARHDQCSNPVFRGARLDRRSIPRLALRRDPASVWG